MVPKIPTGRISALASRLPSRWQNRDAVALHTVLIHFLDCRKYCFRLCALAVGVRLIGPANLSSFVNQDCGGKRNVSTIPSTSSVANIEDIEQLTLGVGKKRKPGFQAISQTSRSFRGVDTHGIKRDPLVGNTSIVAFELNQLGPAKRSPIPAVKNVERRLSRLSSIQPMHAAALVRQLVAGKRITLPPRQGGNRRE